MKELRDYVNKIGDEVLEPLAEEIALKIFKQVDTTNEDTLTVTQNLLRQEFISLLDMKMQVLYLDKTEELNFSDYPENQS